MGYLTVSSFTAFAGDGTLPVRLPGDGTLPTLVGDAKEMSQPAVTVATKVKFTQLVVGSIDGGSSAFSCRDTGPAISQHQARGTLSVGNSIFTIKGVCFNNSTKDMEIVAGQANGGDDASLVSSLPASSTLSRLRGRLVVKSEQALRYTVDLKDPTQPNL